MSTMFYMATSIDFISLFLFLISSFDLYNLLLFSLLLLLVWEGEGF